MGRGSFSLPRSRAHCMQQPLLSPLPPLSSSSSSSSSVRPRGLPLRRYFFCFLTGTPLISLVNQRFAEMPHRKCNVRFFTPYKNAQPRWRREMRSQTFTCSFLLRLGIYSGFYFIEKLKKRKKKKKKFSFRNRNRTLQGARVASGKTARNDKY